MGLRFRVLSFELGLYVLSLVMQRLLRGSSLNKNSLKALRFRGSGFRVRA